MTAEHVRLDEARQLKAPWKKWGPYLSERQWGTVREDYSENGDAWNYLHPRPCPLARLSLGRRRPRRHFRRPAAALLRAGALERQGSDPQGAAVRPDQQRRQPRRGREGVLLLPRQHADALVHEVPLQVSAGARSRTTDLVTTNRRRSRQELEYELLDTGVVRRRSLLRRVRGVREGDARGHPGADHRDQPRPDAADLHVLPTLWFRNDWSAWIAASNRAAEKPQITQVQAPAGATAAIARHPLLGAFTMSCQGDVPLLFTENETNHERLFPGTGPGTQSRHVKDGINDCVVHGQHDGRESRSPRHQGGGRTTSVTVGAGQTTVIRLRLRPAPPSQQGRAVRHALRRPLRQPAARGR